MRFFRDVSRHKARKRLDHDSALTTLVLGQEEMLHLLGVKQIAYHLASCFCNQQIQKRQDQVVLSKSFQEEPIEVLDMQSLSLETP